MLLRGVTKSIVSDCSIIGNESTGLKLENESGNYCLRNIISNNQVFDDGTGRKGSDEGSLTQSVSITETGDSDYNVFSGNLVNPSVSVIGANSSSYDNLSI